MPQLNVNISNMDLIVPVSTTKSDCLIVSMNNLAVINDVLKDDLSHKQYEFIMDMLSGNLGESSQIASRVYPVQQGQLDDGISEEQRKELQDKTLDAGKQQMESKGLSVSVGIGAVSARLLKRHGIHNGKNNGGDLLVGFTIEDFGTRFSMNPQTSEMEVKVSMADMSFVDVSLDTKNAGEQAEFRKLISLDTAIVKRKKREKLKTLSVAAENNEIGAITPADLATSEHPFYTVVTMNSNENIVDVSVSFVGLQLTFGSVLYTLLAFAVIEPAQFDA